jgi:hypothetical protein
VLTSSTLGWEARADVRGDGVEVAVRRGLSTTVVVWGEGESTWADNTWKESGKMRHDTHNCVDWSGQRQSPGTRHATTYSS